MPRPGDMVHLSPDFTPAYLKGIIIQPDNALKFDFLVDKGSSPLNGAPKKQEYNKLIKYFLAALTVPDKDQWVNLSPYEKNRIIEGDFGKTEMGRDLLAQDYLLKQITSSLMYPDSGLGKKFWDKVYERAYKEFGNTNIPVNTFNKVWIVPDEAVVYESGNIAYVVKSHLKVMLEEDYLSLTKHNNSQSQTHSLSSKIIKEIILPAIEKEVNEGQNFAMLRQVFASMLLATWYKKALRQSLLGRIYADKSKVLGVNQDPKNNEAIYQEYLQAFKKGVFNFIREDADRYSHQVIPRKYFAGGSRNTFDEAMTVRNVDMASLSRAADPDMDAVTVSLDEYHAAANPAMAARSHAQELGALLSILGQFAWKYSTSQWFRLQRSLKLTSDPQKQMELVTKLARINDPEARDFAWRLLTDPQTLAYVNASYRRINNAISPAARRILADAFIRNGGERGQIVAHAVEVLRAKIPAINDFELGTAVYSNLPDAIAIYEEGYEIDYRNRRVAAGRSLQHDTSADAGRVKQIEQIFSQNFPAHADDRDEGVEERRRSLGDLIIALDSPGLKMKYAEQFIDQGLFWRKAGEVLSNIVFSLHERQLVQLAEHTAGLLQGYSRREAFAFLTIIVPHLEDQELMKRYLAVAGDSFLDDRVSDWRIVAPAEEAFQLAAAILIKLKDENLTRQYFEKMLREVYFLIYHSYSEHETRFGYFFSGMDAIYSVLAAVGPQDLRKEFASDVDLFFGRVEGLYAKNGTLKILGRAVVLLDNASPEKLRIFVEIFGYTHKRYYDPLLGTAYQAVADIAATFDNPTRVEAMDRIAEHNSNDYRYVSPEVAAAADATFESYTYWLHRGGGLYELSNKQRVMLMLMGFTPFEISFFSELNKEIHRKRNWHRQEAFTMEELRYSPETEDRTRNLVGVFLEPVPDEDGLYAMNTKQLLLVFFIRRYLDHDLKEIGGGHQTALQNLEIFMRAHRALTMPGVEAGIHEHEMGGVAGSVSAVLRAWGFDPDNNQQVGFIHVVVQAAEIEREFAKPKPKAPTEVAVVNAAMNAEGAKTHPTRRAVLTGTAAALAPGVSLGQNQGRSALNPHKALSWLNQQINPSNGLINSFTGLPDSDVSKSVTWMYNQGQAIQEYLALSDLNTAEILARGALKVRKDGQPWLNAYFLATGENATNLAEQRQSWVGPNAVLGHAILNLLDATKDKKLAEELLKAAMDVARWMNASVYRDFGSYGFVVAADGSKIATTEHNMRAAAFYYQFDRQFSNPSHPYHNLYRQYGRQIRDLNLKKHAQGIIDWVQGQMWDAAHKRYNVGYDDFTQRKLKTNDDDAWSYTQYITPLMAKIAGLDPRQFSGGMDWLMSHLSAVEIDGVSYKGVSRWHQRHSLWGKGTAETILALRILGRENEAKELYKTLAVLQAEDGGIKEAVGEGNVWPHNFPYSSVEASMPYIMVALGQNIKFMAQGAAGSKTDKNTAMTAQQFLDSLLNWARAVGVVSYALMPAMGLAQPVLPGPDAVLDMKLEKAPDPGRANAGAYMIWKSIYFISTVRLGDHEISVGDVFKDKVGAALTVKSIKDNPKKKGSYLITFESAQGWRTTIKIGSWDDMNRRGLSLFQPATKSDFHEFDGDNQILRRFFERDQNPDGPHFLRPGDHLDQLPPGSIMKPDEAMINEVMNRRGVLGLMGQGAAAAALGASFLRPSSAKARVVLNPAITNPRVRGALEVALQAGTSFLTTPIDTQGDEELKQLAAAAQKYLNEDDVTFTFTPVDLQAQLREELKREGFNDSYITEMLSKGSARSMIQKIDDHNYRIYFDVRTLQYGVAGIIVGLAHEVIAHRVVNERGLSNLQIEREAFRLELKFLDALMKVPGMQGMFPAPADNIWQEIHQMIDMERGTLRWIEQNIKNDKAQPSDLGGIDFNAANFAMVIKRDGRGVPLPISQQDLARLAHLGGFVPRILDIRPAAVDLAEARHRLVSP